MINSENYIESLKLGSQKAFGEIMEYWYTPLYNFALGYLNNSENTKEVIQDVFLKLWDNRNNLNENTNLNAYLYAVTRNRCIDVVRRERLMIQFQNHKKEEYLRLTESFEALSDPILDNLFANEVQHEINRAVEHLPEQCKKVFIMSRKEGMKNKEISQSLHLSEKTIESHLTKALKTIRLALERQFPGSLQLIMMLTKRFLKK